MKNSAYVLIDRSGSMASKWEEVIGGVNSFVYGLPKNTNVVVSVFDSGNDWYKEIRNTKQQDFEKITRDTISPRGMTALNDALGRFLGDALKDKGKKAIVAIITDGAENASKEVKAADVKSMISKVKDKGYEIVWLGAEYSGVDAQASSYGFDTAKFMNVSKGNAETTYRGLSVSATRYFSSSTEVKFSDLDKAEAVK